MNESNENTKFNESNESTYCPEDNKLRLYVGRVPREEWLELKSDGWKSTPKQESDFVATWTPSREATCIDYAGFVGDEDTGPAERAADRAERFAGYREKRIDDALSEANRFDTGDDYHGSQNQKRAEREAKKRFRAGSKAVDQWSKAEYWQSRTAGVISNALYLSSPHVRMGRIKKIETRLRVSNLCPKWRAHYELLIAYENQMMDAQGGQARDLEMVIGGIYKKYIIHRLHKSNASGKICSISVYYECTDHKKEIAETGYSSMRINIERRGAEDYREPTEKSLEILENIKASIKAHKKANPKKTIPLINPTDEDAERLQKIINEQKKHYWRGEAEPTPMRLSQAVYSENSKGAYARCESIAICQGGAISKSQYWNAKPQFDIVAKVRSSSFRVVILKDKPQKAFPKKLWEDLTNSEIEYLKKNSESLNKICRCDTTRDFTDPQWEMFNRAHRVGMVYHDSQSQFGISESGHEILGTFANA